MKKTLIFVGLTAYALAIPVVKRSLAQTQDDGMEMGEGEVVHTPVTIPSTTACSCELPEDFPSSGFPSGSGSGLLVGFGSHVVRSEAEEVVSVPDTEFTSTCETASCACVSANH